MARVRQDREGSVPLDAKSGHGSADPTDPFEMLAETGLVAIVEVLNGEVVPVALGTPQDSSEIQFTHVVSRSFRMPASLDDPTRSCFRVLSIAQHDLSIDHDRPVTPTFADIAVGLTGEIVSERILAHGDRVRVE